MSGILTSPLNVPTPATSKIPVLTLSVAAIPVKLAPLIAGNAPVKFPAVRLVSPDPLPVAIPVKNISPSLLKVIPLPTTIPFCAVIRPTASTFVTSS